MKKILFLAVLVFSMATNAQVALCKTDEILKDNIKNNPLLKQRIDFMNKQIANKQTNKTAALPAPESIKIPVVVYVVNNGESIGTGTNISDNQVQAQLTALNSKFYNSGIKFCLATRAGTGVKVPMKTTSELQPTAGIIHIKAPELTAHLSTPAGQAALINTAHASVTGDKYLRIWVVNSIDGGLPGTLGYAWFPNGSTYDGIVIRNNVFGNGSPNLLSNFSQGETLVHEVGHYLGLYHTFEGGCSTGSCLENGDLVCDTPTVAQANYGCVTGTNSCPESPAVPDLIRNYMDYGDNVCADSLTNGQKQRMIDVINMHRSNLISTSNIIYTGSCDFKTLTSASITPSAYTVCASATSAVTFSTPSSSSYTYSWNFGDPLATGESTGANPNTSTANNPSHIFTSALHSPYTVTLTVYNTITGQTAYESVKIFVTSCAPINNFDSNWYFSSANMLSFNSGIPVFDHSFPSANYTWNASSTQSNASGNLLFYTNGISIWNNGNNAINTIAPIGLMARSNQILSVPDPGNINRYYVLSAELGLSDAQLGLRYSIVNVSGMSATVGLQNQPITQTTTFNMSPSVNHFSTSPTDGAVIGAYTISAVKKCDGYWILTTLRKGPTMEFMVVFSLTNSGIKYHSEWEIPNAQIDNLSYYAEVSPNGNKIFLYAISGQINNYILDFNKVEGLVSDAIQIGPGVQVTSASFSPDSKLLYTSEEGKICQFSVGSADINASKMVVKQIYNTSPQDMQRGPDNKIYVIIPSNSLEFEELAVIHSPNVRSTNLNSNACNFDVHGPKKIITNSDMYQKFNASLPNTIDAKHETAYFFANNSNIISAYLVGCNKYKFFPNYNTINCAARYQWVVTRSSTVVTTTNTTTPVFDFGLYGSGSYTVTLKINTGTVLGTYPLTVSAFTAPAIQGNTTACVTETNRTNNFISLTAGQTVVWSITGGAGAITGSNTQSSVDVNWTVLPGTLTATVTNQEGCTATTTKTITSLCPCNCLSTMYIKMTPQLGDHYRFNVMNTNTNITCAGLNLRYVWSFSSGYTVTNTTGVVYNTEQVATVLIELLSPTGTVICSVTRVYPTSSTGNGKTNIETITNETPNVIVNPNPSQGLFNLLIEGYYGKLNIKVIDTNGREVFNENEEHFQTEKLLNLNHLSSGIYILRVNGESINSTQRIIKN